MSDMFIVDDNLQDVRLDKYLNELLKRSFQNLYSKVNKRRKYSGK